MSGLKNLEIIEFLVLMILIGNVSAAQQITINDIMINDNDTGSAILVLDTAPQGLSGFTIDLSVTDPKIAEIYSVTYPSGFGLTDTSPVPFTEGHISGVDLKDTNVPENLDSVLLASVGVRGISQGTTTLHGSVRRLNDTSGGNYQLNTTVDEGIITVENLPTSDSSQSVRNIDPSAQRTNDNMSSVTSRKFPKTDDDRQQFTNELKKKGYSDEEIAAEIIALIRSSHISDTPNGEMVDNDGPRMSADEIQEELLNLNIDVIDTSVKNASTLYFLLIPREYQQQNILSDIDASDNDPSVMEELKESLKRIWKKYPVDFITKGNRTIIRFDLENQNVTLTPEENKILEVVNEIHLKQLVSTSNTSVKWWGEPGHATFIHLAILQNTLSVHPLHNYSYTAGQHAGDPDQNIPWNLPDHYYNPDYGTGWAPQRTDESFNYAKIYFNSQAFESSAIAIAYASHYLTDVGNPFHTGREGDTILNQTTHQRYESWVASRWDSSPFYFGHYAREHYYDFLNVENPSDSTIQVAQYSHPYLETIWTKFYYDTDEELENDEWVITITRDCVDTAGRYTYGMVDYLTLTKFPGYANYSKDNDADNRYEDINGNSRVDYDDVVAYFNDMDFIESSQPFRLFDYNRNGNIDYNDIIWLYDQI